MKATLTNYTNTIDIPVEYVVDAKQIGISGNIDKISLSIEAYNDSDKTESSVVIEMSRKECNSLINKLRAVKDSKDYLYSVESINNST